MTKKSIRILSVVHHPLFREGIATVIENQADMLLVAEASNASEAFEHFDSHRPDITLMDLRLPDSSGIEAMIALRAQFADARVILLSNFEGDFGIQHALEAGASGCILKTMHPRQIAETIRLVHAAEKSACPPRSGRSAEQMGDDVSVTSF